MSRRSSERYWRKVKAHEARSHHNKQPFTSIEQARQVRYEMAERKGRPQILLEIHPYKCRHCGLWHLGHRYRREYLKICKALAAQNPDLARRVWPGPS